MTSARCVPQVTLLPWDSRDGKQWLVDDAILDAERGHITRQLGAAQLGLDGAHLALRQEYAPLDRSCRANVREIVRLILD